MQGTFEKQETLLSAPSVYTLGYLQNFQCFWIFNIQIVTSTDEMRKNAEKWLSFLLAVTWQEIC